MGSHTGFGTVSIVFPAAKLRGFRIRNTKNTTLIRFGYDLDTIWIRFGYDLATIRI